MIDLVNGMSSRESNARSLVSFYDMGFYAGEYIAGIQNKSSKPFEVVWLPGPKGAAWVESGNRGFEAALKDKNIKLLSTRYGDVNRSIQAKLIKQALEEHKDIDFIVGTSATALAGVQLFRRDTSKNKPQLMSYYMTRGIYNAILRKQVLAAPTDPTCFARENCRRSSH